MNLDNIIKFETGLLRINMEMGLYNEEIMSVIAEIAPIEFEAPKYSTDENHLVSFVLKVMKARVQEIERMLKEEQL